MSEPKVDWEKEPPDDLRLAGERMSFAECDEMLMCIAAILDEHLLNGVTHAHMIRWKLREAAYALAAARSQQVRIEQDYSRTASLLDAVATVLVDGTVSDFEASHAPVRMALDLKARAEAAEAAQARLTTELEEAREETMMALDTAKDWKEQFDLVKENGRYNWKQKAEAAEAALAARDADRLRDAIENFVEHVHDEDCSEHGCRWYQDLQAAIRPGREK